MFLVMSWDKLGTENRMSWDALNISEFTWDEKHMFLVMSWDPDWASLGPKKMFLSRFCRKTAIFQKFFYCPRTALGLFFEGPLT